MNIEPVHMWKSHPAYKDSGVRWQEGQESKAFYFFQTGLTGSTGCVLSFDPVHPVILSKMNKPQMKAPRVTPLEGVSTSTVTPVDCVHTYASALAYVDGRPQGAQPLTYAPQGIRVRGVEGTQSCASGERVHVCPARAYVLFGSREPLGFGLENPQGFGSDERRLITSAHLKERKAAQQYLHFCIEKHQRRRTRMTQIRRIFTDNLIRAHPCHPCDPCSITFMEGKRSYQWSFYKITHKEAAQSMSTEPYGRWKPSSAFRDAKVERLGEMQKSRDENVPHTS